MDNFKKLIKEALTPDFLKEPVNETKAKIGSKIKVHRDEYDKKPLTMTLSRKIPGDYDDAYEATYETIPTGIPKRSEKKTLKVAYGSLGWKNNPIWFLMNPTDLEKKRTPYTESINEGMDEEYILNNLDKWLPNLSPGPFHFYDIIDDGDVDEMVDLIHTYGDEEVLKDYGLDPWDREDVTQLANYIVSRGNQVNEDEGWHPQKKYSMDEVKREIDLAVQQGEALLKYQMGDYGEVGEYEAWESLKEDLIEIHQQSVIENIEGFTNFVDNNDGNKLPNRSSGSFMTGILDIDGLLAALNFEEQDHKGYDLYSQEEWDEASNYWTAKVQKLNHPKYD